MKKVKSLLVAMLMVLSVNTQAMAVSPEVNINDTKLEIRNISNETKALKLTFTIINGSTCNFEVADELANAYVRTEVNGNTVELYVVDSVAFSQTSNAINLGEIEFSDEILSVNVEAVTTNNSILEYNDVELVVDGEVTENEETNNNSNTGGGSITVIPPSGYVNPEKEENEETEDLLTEEKDEETDEKPEITTEEQYEIVYKTYTDVEASWAKESIAYVVTEGLFKGISENEFAPTMNMDRSMFVTVLSRLSGEETTSKTTKFVDVQSDSWYSGAVSWAVENSITSGTSETTFSPTNPVTREQMAVFLLNYAKAMNVEIPTTNAKSVFADDGAISAWATEAVYVMQQAGVLTGKVNNMFDPQGEAARAEVAVMIERFVNLK